MNGLALRRTLALALALALNLALRALRRRSRSSSPLSTLPLAGQEHPRRAAGPPYPQPLLEEVGDALARPALRPVGRWQEVGRPLTGEASRKAP